MWYRIVTWANNIRWTWSRNFSWR